ncbi:hypothetical protein NE857_08110 [Nocardiopsis exhalans]|uniref:Uncharacterized protein n=1 Tax=Nocardiopsis exhalans TaxID=163604 RepID=A0ABY5DDI8_9ACTN|nr:hypothetical protein [Nocardiopsis exhalans]USY21558.1 hypothetical protein NE857_08110 [Nocardiopsis exhalans]
MYGLIWHILPGPWASKFIMAVGLLAGGAALLWFFAFPAISPHMPFNDGAVDTTGIGGAEVPEGEVDPEAVEVEGEPEAEEGPGAEEVTAEGDGA